MKYSDEEEYNLFNLYEGEVHTSFSASSIVDEVANFRIQPLDLIASNFFHNQIYMRIYLNIMVRHLFVRNDIIIIAPVRRIQDTFEYSRTIFGK